jgi:hypothetical protein
MRLKNTAKQNRKRYRDTCLHYSHLILFPLFKSLKLNIMEYEKRDGIGLDFLVCDPNFHCVVCCFFPDWGVRWLVGWRGVVEDKKDTIFDE